MSRKPWKRWRAACLGGLELGVVGARDRLVEHRGQVVADGVRQHEVAVGQALHERRRAEAVGAVVAEVGLARGVQAGHGGHQLVVHPQATHRVVAGGVDAHRHLLYGSSPVMRSYISNRLP
jgi:hypothetical protein